MSKRPFEQVVADHGASILHCCRALVGPVDGDDAWSETFLAALRAYPDLDDGANVEAWLVTIAHRKAIDIGRKRARQPVTMLQLPEPRAASAPSATGPDGTDHDLWAAVRALPDKQRQSVAYHYLVGLPYTEIAVILGGTAEAARRAAADGIHHLRRTFADGALAKGRSR